MFSSPAIRPYSQENLGQTTARKPGNNVSSRKPFHDRTVNSKTPDITRNLKPKIQLTKDNDEQPVGQFELDDFMFSDICSYNDVRDNFEDICPKSQQNKILDILDVYCNYREVKTPLPEIDDELLHIPEYSFLETANHSVDDEVFEESVEEEISMPEIDFDDFDII